MRRNLTYSALVFGLLCCWVLVGAITQIAMGVLPSSDLGFILPFTLFASALGAVIFFVVFRFIQRRIFGGTVEPNYRPTRSFAVVAIVLVGAAVVGSIAQSYSVAKPKAEAAALEARRTEAAQRLQAEQAEKERQRLAAMTPGEREAEEKQKEDAIANASIANAQALLQRSREWEAWGESSLAGKKPKMPNSKPVMKEEWSAAQSRLDAIKPKQAQYQKAQGLLRAMAEDDKRRAAASAKFEARARIGARKEFAKNLEQLFIERRMNTDVTASGPKNTVLEIKWVLASKVTANDLGKSGIIEKAEQAGFKKVIFTDGYDRAWRWDLNPKAE